MTSIRRTNARAYSSTDLTMLFEASFGDRLSEAQIDSLVNTVLAAHADRQEVVHDAVPREAAVGEPGIAGLTFPPGRAVTALT